MTFIPCHGYGQPPTVNRILGVLYKKEHFRRNALPIKCSNVKFFFSFEHLYILIFHL